MYMVWTGLGCLIQCVNSIFWHKNIIDRVLVYCDIGRFSMMLPVVVRSLNHLTVTRIQAGLNVAIPACSLCINRRLYKIATAKAVMVTRSEKRRKVIIDLLICIGIPLLQMAAGEYWPFTPDQVVDTDVMQNTSFRDIAMTYLKMLGRSFR